MWGYFASKKSLTLPPPYGGSGVIGLSKPVNLAQDPFRFEAPLDFSSLKEIHKGTTDTLIIHIQDAHSNLSGQENLAKTLDEIMKKYGVYTVLVEGSSKDSTLDPIKEIAPSKQILERTARSFLIQGKIAGEEYLNLTSDHPMKILGIEDRALYMQSIENYAKLARQREETIAYLKKIQIALEKLKNRLYPKELLEYEKAKGNTDQEMKALLNLSDSSMIDRYPNFQVMKTLQNKESQIDFNLANLEQAALVEKLGKDEKERLLKNRGAGKSENRISQLTFFQNTFNLARDKKIDLTKYPNWTAYKKYLEEFSAVDLEKLIDETEAMENEIYAKRLVDSDTKLVRSIDRYLKLLETAYKIQMSTKDFETFEANEPDFATLPYLAFINRKLIELGYFEDLLEYKDHFEEGKKALQDFYVSVSQRDLAFVQNTERLLKDQSPKTAILISGGYHTQHLKELFEEKGYSYIVLTPNVTAETNQKKYEALLSEALSIPARKLGKEALGEEKIMTRQNTDKVSTPKAAMIAASRLAEFGQAMGIDGARMSEVIRKIDQRPDNLRLLQRNKRYEKVIPGSGARLSDGSTISPVSGTPEPQTVQLDPSWRIKFVSGDISTERLHLLEEIMKSLIIYWPGVRFRQIIIKSSVGDLLETDANLGAIQIGNDAWRSSDILKFTILRGLSALQLDQSVVANQVDMQSQERLKQRKERLEHLQSLHAPFLIVMNEYKMVRQADPVVDPAIRKIIYLIRMARYLAMFFESHAVREAILNNLQDRSLAELLEKLQERTPFDVSVLYATQYLQAHGETMPRLGSIFESDQGRQPTNLLTPEEYQKQMLDLPAREPDRDYADPLSVAHKNHFENLVYALDIIFNADINDQKLAQVNKGLLDRLARIIGPDDFSILSEWYGPAVEIFTKIITKNPSILDFLEDIGPEAGRSALFYHLSSLQDFYKHPEEETKIDVHGAMKQLRSIMGPEAVHEAVSRRPADVIRALGKIGRTPGLLNRLNPLIRELERIVGENRIRVQFSENPLYFINSLINLVALRLHRSEGIYGFFSKNPEGLDLGSIAMHLPTQTLTLEWLVGFDEMQKNLIERFGGEFFKKVFQKNPLKVLELMALLHLDEFSMAGIDQLLAYYGKANLDKIWQNQPNFFPEILFILLDSQRLFLQFDGRQAFVNMLTENPQLFMRVWWDWLPEEIRTSVTGTERTEDSISILMGLFQDYSEYSENGFLDGLEDIWNQQRSWMSHDAVGSLFEESPDLLENITKSLLYLSDGTFDENEKLREAAARSLSWTKWDKFEEIIGHENLEDLLRNHPRSLANFLAVLASWKKEGPASDAWAGGGAERLENFKRAIGERSIYELIKDEPLFVVRDIIYRQRMPEDKSVIAWLSEMTKEVWGDEAFTSHTAWAARFYRSNGLRLLEMLKNPAQLRVGRMSGENVKSALASALKKEPEAVADFLKYKTESMGKPYWKELLAWSAAMVGPQTTLDAFAKSPEEFIQAVRNIGERAPSASGFRDQAQTLQSFFGWKRTDTKRIFLEAPETFAELAAKIKERAGARLSTMQEIRESWGENGAILLSEARKNAATSALYLDSLAEVESVVSFDEFLQTYFLPLARQRMSGAIREGWNVNDHLQEVRMVWELSQRNIGINEADAILLWRSFSDKMHLPIDQLKNVSFEDILQQERALIERVIKILSNADPDSKSFEAALGLAVQMPSILQTTLSRIDRSRQELIKKKAEAEFLTRLFNSLKGSPADKGILNALTAELLFNLMQAQNGATQEIDHLGTYLKQGNWTAAQRRAWTETYGMVTMSSVLERLKVLGISFESPQKFFGQISPGLLSELIGYVLDNMNTPPHVFEELTRFLEEDTSFLDYLSEKISGGLQSDVRSKDYQNVLRLMMWLPRTAMLVNKRLQRISLSESQRNQLKADAVNAVAANEFNRILITHADLILAQEQGQGLVSLSSKVGIRSPLDLKSLQEMMTIRGYPMDADFTQRSLDPTIYRVWRTMVVPRLFIMRNGYRGARSFDDKEAQYITRSITVAETYAYKGGEAAAGEGERVIHQWNFPIAAQNTAVLEIREGASFQWGRGGQSFGTWKIVNNQLVLDPPFTSTFTQSPTASLELQFDIPEPGAVSVITIPPLNKKSRPIVLQVGRMNGQLFIMSVDGHVALANVFTHSPGQDAYVRKISTEGKSDFEVIRLIIRMQSEERLLIEEVLDAVRRLKKSENVWDAIWAMHILHAALQDLDPRHLSEPDEIGAGFETSYFLRIFGPLLEILQNAETEMVSQKLPPSNAFFQALNERIQNSFTLKFLFQEEHDLTGTFEAYERRFIFDPYRGELRNRRTMGNRFLELLRSDANPARAVQDLYERGDLDYFLGEITALRGVGQSLRFHRGINADQHTIKVLAEIDKLIESHEYSVGEPEQMRLLALFHDAGKSKSGTEGHAGHSAEALSNFLRSVEAPEVIIRRLTRIVELHQVLGNITASRVRRIASGRSNELNDPSFLERQNERVERLAKALETATNSEMAQENLSMLYLLTIADTRAIPFDDGDTGSRYTTLFAKELEYVRDLVDNAIKVSGARLAQVILPDSDGKFLTQDQSFPKTVVTHISGLGSLQASLPLVTPNGILPIAVSGAHLAIFQTSVSDGVTAFQLATPSVSGFEPIPGEVLIFTQKDTQEAGARLVASRTMQSNPLPARKISIQVQGALDSYEDKETITRQLLRNLVQGLSETQHVTLFLSPKDQHQGEMLAQLLELEGEIKKLNEGPEEKPRLYLYSRFIDETGKEIPVPGFVVKPIPAGVSVKIAYSGILHEGLLKEAIKNNAAYLPIDAAYTGSEGDVHIIPYKADMRASIATLLDESIAKRMLENLVDGDIEIDSAKMKIIREPFTLKNISIEIYKRERLIVRALAKLSIDEALQFAGARLAAIARSA